MTLKDGELMTRGDAVKALGLSPTMVSKLEARGVLPAVRTVGGFALFWKKDVEKLARKRATNPPKRRGYPAKNATP